MTLNDWVNSTIGEPGSPSYGTPSARPRPRQMPDVADIHQWLDSITRQIEQISRPATPRGDTSRSDARNEPTVARQLNEAISRLDARLSQISNPAPTRQAQMQEKQRQSDLVERAAAQVYRPSPPLSPASMDFSIAEIVARQNELDGRRRARRFRQSAPAASLATVSGAGRSGFFVARAAFAQDHQPDRGAAASRAVEESIAAFRGELAEIRQAITEAVPRREIESLENEIRSLSRRIDENRQHGSDGQTLAGIESALGEIREVLRSLTPAEQLTGYDEAIRNLGAKLDLILRANDDPSTVQQLESAIAALRGIVSNVASNDALARLAEDVHTLSAKVDQLPRFDANSDAWGMIEQRLTALTATLEAKQPPAASEHSELLEAVRTLSERLDRMPVGNDNASAFAHLEQRVSYLLERLEASGNDRSSATPAVDLGRVEEGLHDILRSLERQHASLVALADSNSRAPPTPPRRWTPASSIWSSASSPTSASVDRKPTAARGFARTVNSTLGHVVDRLSTIEGDLRTVRTEPQAAPFSSPPLAEAREEMPRPMSRCRPGRSSRSRNCRTPPRCNPRTGAICRRTARIPRGPPAAPALRRQRRAR